MFVWPAIFIIRMGAVCTDHVHISWNDHTEDLFACPQRFGFENGRLRNFAVPVKDPHHQIHHCILRIKIHKMMNKNPSPHKMVAKNK